MPELPEVETVARDLQNRVAGATIAGTTVSWGRTIRHPQPPERFAAEIAGATIQRVGRRAKTVLLHFEDARVMTVALRMTGALLVAEAGAPADPYARVVFDLADGRQLRYRDVRKFGRIGLWPGGGLRSVGGGRGARSKRVKEGMRRYRIGEVFSGHGPEPLSRTFTRDRLVQRLSRRSAKVKSLLLDQSFIAGVGNIYADEALWRARLHPLRTADSLDEREVRRLHRAVRQVLRQGIVNRGASLSDYVGADGEPGANAERLAVYRRTEQPCYRCGRPIRRIVVGQRSTHFCPRCQPEPVASETP
ncbi:MAG: bifunctional DNA-formamidopyrimidine glycosylase/DNA-(apurinic or apyrimidinic site) lyase [Candidatus Limnocylindria bacterium]